jgi:hypothetical protein
MSVLSILNELAADNSRLAKEAILKRELNNEDLKYAFRLALDPNIQFYIRRIPEFEKSRKEDTLNAAMHRLDLLTGRILTGNAGFNHLSIVLGSVSADDAEVIKRIIGKDLRCGVNEATVNKIWRGLIPEYPCMLASAYDQKLVNRVRFPAIAQLKLDGMRFNAIVKNGQVEFRSRNGKEVNIPNEAFAQVFVGLAAFYGDDRVFDGELLVAGTDGQPLDRKTGNGILNKAVKNTQSEAEAALVRATLWDSISLENFQQGMDSEPYQIRLAKLSNCLDAAKSHLVNLAPTTRVNDIDEARAIFEQYLTAGQEGIILKTNDGIWENKRSKSLIKFKGELECDLLCVGWEEGTGKNVGRLGALVLESGCGKVRVNVGTGFSDADRVAFTSSNSIGRVVAVKYNARITDKSSTTDSLFLPVFIEFRDDKDTADADKDIK